MSSTDKKSALMQAYLLVQELEAKLDAAERAKHEPIAVIGMGCRFPGGVDGPDSLWKVLRSGTDGTSEIPRDRWDVDAYYHPKPPVPGKMYMLRGGFLTVPIDAFDAEFFGISPREALQLDPQQRLLLEVAWEALENAGVPPDSLLESVTGVYVGMMTNDYAHLQISQGITALDTYMATGTAWDMAAGRLSYILGLQGPSMAVATACSSSLVSIHLACKALRAGECALALAGGVSLMLSPNSSVAMCQMQAVASDGRSKTFDAAADGYGRGEGCGVVVLKRLSDALAAGDRIMAVIRGSAVNHDGPSGGLTVPSGPAQERLILTALADAGAAPTEISYIEAHGTGTSLGDPIEIRAIASTLGRGRKAEDPLLIGSAKTNFGHMEASAGVGGLSKVVLALQHGEIPPHLHFRTPNPHIPWGDAPLKVTSEVTAWPATQERRLAGVSSFGLGGINAHIVLEAPPAAAAVDAGAPEASPGLLRLLPLSAKTEPSLRAMAARYRDALRATPASDLGAFCATASLRRTHFSRRLAVIGATPEAMAEALDAYLDGAAHPGLVTGQAHAGSKVAFVFPGQGSQWAGMGRGLLESEPAFQQAIAACEAAFAPHVDWSLSAVLTGAPGAPPLERIDVVQPTLFAVAVGLAALWRSWGIEPQAVIGHSQGEIAAAYVAGALSLEDAARVICQRSRILLRVSGKGAMAVVELTLEETAARLVGVEDRLAVAVSNSPRSTVVSGDPEAIDALIARLTEEGIFCRHVKVDIASHSPQMDPLRADMLAAFGGLRPRAGKVPIYSTVTGEVETGAGMDATYWARNLREPVQFARTFERLIAAGFRSFVEVSPHPILAPVMAPVLARDSTRGVVVSSGRRDGGAHGHERAEMLLSLGALFAHGHRVDWKRQYPAGGPVLPLPTYPFQRERFWLTDGAAPTAEPAHHRPRADAGGGNPLLGVGFTMSVHPGTRYWERAIRRDTLPYLVDHQVGDAVLLPGAACVEMALAAAHERLGEAAYVLEDVVFREALVLRPGEEPVVQLALTEEGPGAHSFRVASAVAQPAPGPGDQGLDGSASASWVVHATGRIRLAAGDHDDRSKLNGASEGSGASERLDAIRARCTRVHTGAELYGYLDAQALRYGPAFQGVEQVWSGPGEALGRVVLPEAAGAEEPYQIHPALLDACFHVPAALALDTDSERTVGPAVLETLDAIEVHARPQGAVWSHVRARPRADGLAGVEGEVTLLDDEGRALVRIRGLRGRVLDRSAADGAQQGGDDLFLAIDWARAELSPEPAAREAPASGRWLLLADRGGLADALQPSLEAAGAEVIRVEAIDPPAGRQGAGDARRVDPGDPAAVAALLGKLFADGPCRGVLNLWGLDAPTLDALPAGTPLDRVGHAGWASTLHLVQGLTSLAQRDPPRLFLVTARSQPVSLGGAPVEPSQAPLQGLGGTIAAEHPELRCTRIDLGAAPGRVDAREATALVRELLADSPEDQIALRARAPTNDTDGAVERYVARLVQRPPSPPGERIEPAGDRSYRTEIHAPGVLDRIHLRGTARRPPGPLEVQIEVQAAGLNFIDVLKALGTYPGMEEGPIVLGGEFSGRILAVGEGVSHLQVGDDVLGFAYGSLGSHVTTRAELVVRRPAHLSSIEAAGIPVVFGTAWYGLYTLGRLQAGERVLIHAATGGTGMAAVKLAQRVGAEIFATAGSPEKRAYLREMGIRHVMDSRRLTFADEIMKATAGQGVDVVLNSLSGPAIEKGMAALAPDGRFIELGKRDIYADRTMGLSRFRSSLSFAAVDLAGLPARRPERVQALLREVIGAFERRELTPVPTREMPIERVQEAFHTMARAQHIGKIVLSVGDPSVPVAVPQTSSARIRQEATYLITGGLGGLGLSVASWMAEQGAKHLLLVGRSGVTTDAQREAIAALEAAGAAVTVAQVDVADHDRLAEFLRAAIHPDRPLRGVVHAAGLLADGMLAQQSVARFEAVMAPKIAGAWNLHAVTRGMPLDFFVLYSSAASLLGAPGQGNYAAANAFLDALAHHRRALGLPAMSINWGAFAEVGLAAAQDNRGARLEGRGIRNLTPAEGQQILGRLLDGNPVQVGAVPLDIRQWIEFYPRAAESPLLSDFVRAAEQGARRSGDAELLGGLRAAEPAARRELLETFVREQVAQVLRLAPARIDREAPLTNLGIDSLMGLELRNRLEAGLGLTLSATLIWAYPTITRLSERLLDLLGLAVEAAAPAPPKVEEPEPDGLDDASQDETVAMVAQQLAELEELLS